MNTSNGSLVLAIGTLHELTCVLAGAGLIAPPGAAPRNLFAEIARDGFVGAVAQDPLRLALFWSACFGLALLLLGSLMRSLELRGQPLPKSFGWQLAALALVGGLSLPASGFWLALPVAWRILRAPGKSRQVQRLAA
jgi:hypothetical protein